MILYVLEEFETVFKRDQQLFLTLHLFLSIVKLNFKLSIIDRSSCFVFLFRIFGYFLVLLCAVFPRQRDSKKKKMRISERGIVLEDKY